jgi:hypothetical protein
MYLKTRSIFKVGVLLNNVFTYVDKVFLCLHIFFSLNLSKSLGNAAFLDVQTEQVMHITSLLQKTPKSKWQEIIIIFFFVIKFFLMKRQF